MRIAALALAAAALHLAPATAQTTDVAGPADAAAEPEKVRAREAAAGEDPLQEKQAKKESQPAAGLEASDSARIYGSLRLNYRFADSDDAPGDGGSRVGVTGEWLLHEDLVLFGRAEAGLNLLDELDSLFKPGTQKRSASGDSVFPRLLYAGIETPDLLATAGKNWSTYYQVSGFTDDFDSTGGSASGTYNADTDGGPTGTGRADGVLQARFLFKGFAEAAGVDPFDLHVQVQHGRPIPGVANAEYGTAVGLSGVLRTRENTEVGLAYNFAKVPERDSAALRAAGIDGNAHALVLGVRKFADDWYLATTLARLENHEATDQFHYFDGWGWEVYARRRLGRRWWLVGGWNWLRPDADQAQARGYRVRYGVLGVRYAVDGLRRLVFVEGRFDDSREEDGRPVGDSVVLGLRWDLG